MALLTLTNIPNLSAIQSTVNAYNSVSGSAKSTAAVTAALTSYNTTVTKTKNVVASVNAVSAALSALFPAAKLPTVGGTASSLNLGSTDTLQKSTLDANKAAFKWVEAAVTTDMFASPDSCLIAISTPIKGSGSASTSTQVKAAQEFKILGFCRGLNIQTGVNVMSFKELRNERNIIIPVKSTTGTITIDRLLGTMPNFITSATKTTGSGWTLDSQSSGMKTLFGLVIVFMSTARKNSLATVYAERCAVQNVSVGVQAGQFALYESVQIIFDRLIDDQADKDASAAALAAATLKAAADAATAAAAKKAADLAAKNAALLASDTTVSVSDLLVENQKAAAAAQMEEQGKVS